MNTKSRSGEYSPTSAEHIANILTHLVNFFYFGYSYTVLYSYCTVL